MDSEDELAVHIEDTGRGRVLRVQGPVDLVNAAVLRQALAETVASGASDAVPSPTVVDLAGVTAVDLCGLQLLCSAHRTFVAQCAPIYLRDAPEWFRQAAVAAGFRMDTLVCSHRRGEECLWRG
jgi:anti-anti-sigma regulatory factor